MVKNAMLKFCSRHLASVLFPVFLFAKLHALFRAYTRRKENSKIWRFISSKIDVVRALEKKCCLFKRIVHEAIICTRTVQGAIICARKLYEYKESLRNNYLSASIFLLSILFLHVIILLRITLQIQVCNFYTLTFVKSCNHFLCICTSIIFSTRFICYFTLIKWILFLHAYTLNYACKCVIIMHQE